MTTILNGQSFIFNQFFQPSIRFNASYNHDVHFSKKDHLQLGQINLNCIVPIKSQLKLAVDWKELFRLRLKKAAKLKVYQLFWHFRPQVNSILLGYRQPAALPPFQRPIHLTYGLTTGISGVHLLLKVGKKPKLLFYSFNIGLTEDHQSIQQVSIPNMSAIIGLAHLKKLTFYWYYGLFVSYNHDLFIPVPFLGFQAKLNQNIWVNVTLPVQFKFAFKCSKVFKLDLGAGLSNFSTAFGYQHPTQQRLQTAIFSNLRLRTNATANIKLSPQAILYLEAGFHFYQLPAFRRNSPPFLQPELGPSIYGAVSLFFSFKKSLLGATIDGIILF